jgi:hypothetical protein
MTEDSSSLAVNFADTPLAKLAKFVGIELKYVNAAGKAVSIALEVVRAVLAAMNLQVLNNTAGLTELDALERREQERQLSLRDFYDRLEAGGKSPAEMALKNRLRDILSK